MSEPTLGEVMRTLTAVTTRLEKIVDDAERKYASKEVVERDLNEVKGDIKALNEERRRDSDWRRQASLAVAVALLGALVAIALAIFAAVTR